MRLIAYGSLMHLDQLPGFRSQRIRVVGWQRLFNHHSTVPTWTQGLAAEDRRRAILNVVPNASTWFNAISMEITDEMYIRLVARELGYHAERISTVSDLHRGDELGEHLLFCADQPDPQAAALLPSPRYLGLCRDGARHWGNAFAQLFDVTTFLADGRTSVMNYLNPQDGKAQTR